MSIIWGIRSPLCCCHHDRVSLTKGKHSCAQAVEVWCVEHSGFSGFWCLCSICSITIITNKLNIYIKRNVIASITIILKVCGSDGALLNIHHQQVITHRKHNCFMATYFRGHHFEHKHTHTVQMSKHDISTFVLMDVCFGRQQASSKPLNGGGNARAVVQGVDVIINMDIW